MSYFKLYTSHKTLSSCRLNHNTIYTYVNMNFMDEDDYQIK